MEIERRKVEVLVEGSWVRVDGLRGVHKGDRFRMFETSGEPVDGMEGIVADSEPSPADLLVPEGAWIVEVNSDGH